MKLIPYTRVSTADQADTGHGLDAQRSAIRRAASASGHTLLAERYDGGVSGKRIGPELAAAMEQCRLGEADGIIVARLDRLARSLANFSAMVARSQREGWTLICLEPSLDLSSSAGRLLAGVLASFAEYERELISDRVRDGLAAAQSKGVRVGARPILDEDTVSLVHSLRESGLGLRNIAHELNRLGVRPARAERWSPDGVRWVLNGRK